MDFLQNRCIALSFIKGVNGGKIIRCALWCRIRCTSDRRKPDRICLGIDFLVSCLLDSRLLASCLSDSCLLRVAGLRVAGRWVASLWVAGLSIVFVGGKIVHAHYYGESFVPVRGASQTKNAWASAFWFPASWTLASWPPASRTPASFGSRVFGSWVVGSQVSGSQVFESS